MDEFEYADLYLTPYKIRGDEIIADRCPFCGGGRHRDKHTFYLNHKKHTYVCHRGSCGERGTFSHLAKEKGVVADYMKRIYENTYKEKKTYTKPKMRLEGVTKKANDYINSRGISDKTIEHFGIRTDSNGNIVFPYYNENGEHELNKIRVPRKYIKGNEKGPKIWQEGGGRPILFGMNLIKDTDTIIITEGEWDCLSVYECGHDNVVSIPFGTENFDWVDECWEWLEGFKKIIIYFDNDNAGRNAAKEAVRKLGIAKVMLVKSDVKDANELMFKHGKDEVTRVINNAEYVPVKHFVRLADVAEYEKDGFLYGITFIDNTIGGCVYGDLNIWTGKRGGAKSSILSQTVIDTVDQGKKVFWYSGELSNARVRHWLETQMCGDNNLETFKNNITGAEEKRVPSHIANILRGWYKDNLYIFGDEGGNSEDDLFEMFEYAYKRYDIRRFIIDNLKTVKFSGGADKYQNQADFVARCKSFCNQFKVHIDLVVHPRKSNSEEMTDEDIGGSVDIIDLADNVIECKRIAYTDIKDKSIANVYDIDTNRADLFMNRLKILKNREYGRAGRECYYKYDVNSRRIVTAFDSRREYGYMKMIENYEPTTQFTLDEQFPF